MRGLEAYVIRNVDRELCRAIRGQEGEIFQDALLRLKPLEQKKVNDIRLSLEYRPRINRIILYFEKDGKRRPILNENSLTEIENLVARSLYATIRERIDLFRGRKVGDYF